MFRFLVLSLIAVVFLQCKAPVIPQGNQDSVDLTTFILVRHAEKESGQNPGLTKAGKERAENLAQMLSKLPIKDVYSTDYRRTQETAKPSADLHQLAVQSYDPRQLAAFAEEIKIKHQGETVLIVGHSNTTPTLAGLLDANHDYPAFDESDYGNLVFVQYLSTGSTKVQFLRF